MTKTADAQRLEQLCAVYERTIPGIIGNPFVPHFPHPKQALLLMGHQHCRSDEVFKCLYGGAAGGGKSDALLMAAAQFVHLPHYRAILLRRTLQEMKKAGAIMDRAVKWWAHLPGVRWNRSELCFTFPSGATIEFGYHEHPDHDGRYQGGEWHFVGFDELTHWPDAGAWEWLGSRIRKAADDSIPLRQIATSNPGSKGHSWVKQRFIGGHDPETGSWVPPRHRFIPATLDDNPSLDRASYTKTLDAMHPTQRARLLEGNWDAREPGDYFRVDWFGQLLDPETQPVPEGSVAVRWWDLAASTDHGNARSSGVRMVRFPMGVRAVTHAVAFWKTPGDRDAAILRQARIDGPGTVVGFEVEPGSGGVAQYDALEAMMRSEGFRVVGARPGKTLPGRQAKLVVRGGTSDSSKEGRAAPVASCLERGYQMRAECPPNDSPWYGQEVGRVYTDHSDGLRLYHGVWTQGYLDELEGFPGLTLKDQVDATSGAWAWLEAHGAGYVPRDVTPSVPAAQQHDVHPDDRAEPESGHQRWTT